MSLKRRSSSLTCVGGATNGMARGSHALVLRKRRLLFGLNLNSLLMIERIGLCTCLDGLCTCLDGLCTCLGGLCTCLDTRSADVSTETKQTALTACSRWQNGPHFAQYTNECLATCDDARKPEEAHYSVLTRRGGLWPESEACYTAQVL